MKKHPVPREDPHIIRLTKRSPVVRQAFFIIGMPRRPSNVEDTYRMIEQIDVDRVLHPNIVPFSARRSSSRPCGRPPGGRGRPGSLQDRRLYIHELVDRIFYQTVALELEQLGQFATVVRP